MFDFHLLSSNLTAYFFSHDHFWLHLIIHIILVITPVALIFITVKSLYYQIQEYLLAREGQNFESHPKNSIPLRLNLFIKKYTLYNQFKLSMMALLTIPITYAILELPKLIINNVIDTDNYIINNAPLELTQVKYLLLLCGLYLLALMANGALKFILNWYKGVVSEGLVKRLRLVIFGLKRKRHMRKSTMHLSPVLLQEVEPICSFSGDSIVVPLLQGGTALTIIAFMMLQNIVLGAAVMALLPIQLVVIPVFQRKINLLVKKRLIEVRSLNLIISMEEGNYAHAGQIVVRKSFHNLYLLRMKLFKTKYLMKAINNFIMNLTPFFFYTVGGYLVIEDKLSLGALVASLASYKDLASTIRELFIYYQSLQDARTRYSEMVKYLFK
ncbi:MAG: hypothetical protein V7784_06675 [Oceanospirillaceae bacterium]